MFVSCPRLLLVTDPCVSGPRGAVPTIPKGGNILGFYNAQHSHFLSPWKSNTTYFKGREAAAPIRENFRVRLVGSAPAALLRNAQVAVSAILPHAEVKGDDDVLPHWGSGSCGPIKHPEASPGSGDLTFLVNIMMARPHPGRTISAIIGADGSSWTQTSMRLGAQDQSDRHRGVWKK